MNRILVTGNAGSGKSTLAREIAARLDIPYSSLDRVVWQSGWKKTPQDEKARLIRELVQPDRWVIDGVSSEVQAAADTVVFLDVERKVSYWRVCKRNWRYLFRSRPELPAGCPEILIIPTLFKIIWNFSGRIRPRILEQASRSSHGFFHLKTNSDVEQFLAMLDPSEMKMTSLELKVWKISETLLQHARYALVRHSASSQQEFDRLDRNFDEASDANEFELALDALEEMGLLVQPRGGFWRDMERAALNMKLNERATSFRTQFHKTRPPIAGQ